jgi:hypothetical protein
VGFWWRRETSFKLGENFSCSMKPFGFSLVSARYYERFRATKIRRTQSPR